MSRLEEIQRKIYEVPATKEATLALREEYVEFIDNEATEEEKQTLMAGEGEGLAMLMNSLWWPDEPPPYEPKTKKEENTDGES